MEPLEALHVVNKAWRQAPLNDASNALCKQAIQVLAAALAEAEKNAPKPEGGTQKEP